MRVGAEIKLSAFTITLDTLLTSKNAKGSFNVDVRQRHESTELVALVALINALIERQGLPSGDGHSPHVTLSYGFTGSMPRTQSMPPVEWMVHEIELVVGGGAPYDYVTLGRWPLGQAIRQTAQAALF